MHKIHVLHIYTCTAVCMHDTCICTCTHITVQHTLHTYTCNLVHNTDVMYVCISMPHCTVCITTVCTTCFTYMVHHDTATVYAYEQHTLDCGYFSTLVY